MEPQSPSDAELEQWIQRYGRIYSFAHGGVGYWYRQLTRREYRLLLTLEEETVREEELVESCLLWPPGWSVDDHLDEPAGDIHVLAGQILGVSGCVDLKKTWDAHRASVSSELEAQMESTIDHVFGGGGNFRRYQDWSYDQLFEAYARAEWVAVNLMGKRIDQQAPPKRKRGLAGSEHYAAQDREAAIAQGADPSSLPDIDSGQMATRPMSEVLALQAITERKQAMRALWNQVPSIPVLPDQI